MADLSIEFTRLNGKFPCAGLAPFLVNHMIRIVDCYMDIYRPKYADSDEIIMPTDIEDKLMYSILYATIWGIGGCLDEFTRDKFDAFLQDLLNEEELITKYSMDMGKDGKEKYPIMKWPKIKSEFTSLFNLFFDQEEMKWTDWENTVPKYMINKELTYLQLSIPTTDSIRMT